MIRVMHGDCRALLPTLEAESCHACVTDPPYALSFMGKAWDDAVAHDPDMWREVWRVLKPGAHLVAFGGTRTFHRMMCAIEDAGFEYRDTLMWLYSTGFPKSHDVSKAIDRSAGHLPPQSVDFNVAGKSSGLGPIQRPELRSDHKDYEPYVPSTPEAATWEGWGTALKPAWEPIILARKPLVGTVAENVLAHGTGALNIDASRVPCSDKAKFPAGVVSQAGAIFGGGEGLCGNRPRTGDSRPGGRWPANVVHDGSAEVEAAFAAFGERGGGDPSGSKHPQLARSLTREDAAKLSALAKQFPDYDFTVKIPRVYGERECKETPVSSRGDSDTASRFFFSAKADSSDRSGSKHPTIKPTNLMRWLVQLVCPPGGLVLDPFAGSGSTGLAADQLGMDAVLIEQSAEYCEDIRRKITADAGMFADVV